MVADVYFQLVDSNGQPFMGTSVDSVELPPTATVVKFRDAVKAKNPNKLAFIDASDLLVYKNKAAFEKRNAAVDEGKEEPLEEDSLLDGLGSSKKEALVVVVPSSFSSPELDQIDLEIKALENSEVYQTLAHKNQAWASPKPTEKEKGEWRLLKEKLAELKKKEDFYRKVILSMNAHSVKKSDKTRKGYKKDTAIKDERLLLSDVAMKMWKKFKFPCGLENKPTFGDFTRAAGFKNDGDVRDYFRKKEEGKIKEVEIKESFPEEEWIWLIGLNQHVNPLLHDKLIMNQDGSLRLVLEHELYEDGARIAENVIKRLYGTAKNVDIKDAASDSSNSP
jgi:hypothetical protein